jgi:hypothetical protein
MEKPRKITRGRKTNPRKTREGKKVRRSENCQVFVHANAVVIFVLTLQTV